MKTYYSLLVFLVISLNSSAFAGLDKVGEIWYNINTDEKIAEVTKKSSYGQYSGDVIIPETIEYDGIDCTVNSIAKDAFYFCDKLTSVSIPNSVASIGTAAFQECSALTSITIPYGVTSIEGYTFSGCKQLSQILLPETLNSIGTSAFSGCVSLTSIVIPSRVEYIYGQAFYRCENLEKIIISDLSSWCKIDMGVGSFGRSAIFNHEYRLFVEDDEITELTIPEEITSILPYTFYRCKSITSVYVSGNITKVGAHSFENCKYVTDVFFTEGVSDIEEEAFVNCERLVNLTLPKSMNNIGSSAFSGCKELLDVYCYAEECPKAIENRNDRWLHNAFDEDNIGYATLHVPASSLDLYKVTKPWRDFGNIVSIIETGVPSISNKEYETSRYYTLSGKLVNKPTKGVNIFRMADGNSKKVILK